MERAPLFAYLTFRVLLSFWVSRLLTDRALCGPVPSPLRGSIIIIGVISRANTYRPHWVRQPR
jgi:hypothetical protein